MVSFGGWFCGDVGQQRKGAKIADMVEFFFPFPILPLLVQYSIYKIINLFLYPLYNIKRIYIYIYYNIALEII